MIGILKKKKAETHVDEGGQGRWEIRSEDAAAALNR